MEDKQMDYVIGKIRENEEKTEALTTVLEGFHQSFDKLIGNIEKVLQTGTIDQATKSVRQLDTHLGRIEKQIVIQQDENKQILGQMVESLAVVNHASGQPAGKKERINSITAQSEKSLYYNEALYIIDETGLKLLKYDLNTHEVEVVTTMDSGIQSIGLHGEAIYLHDREERIYVFGQGVTPLIEGVVAYQMTDYGIIYKNQVGNLKLYKYDGLQKSLGKRIEYFEIVGGHYLLFQGNKAELQLLDLEALDAQHPPIMLL